jgi:hypothetical protein
LTSRPEPRLLKLPGLWLAFPTDVRAVGQIVDRCLGMLLLSEDPLAIELQDVARGVVRIRFRGRARHRKTRLLKALVAKQFRGILPRIRIHLT